MEQHDIKKLLPQQGAELFERYEVAFAYLFGSANSGHFRSQSDIDIAARFKAGHSSHELLRLSALLELALKKLLRRKVDLVIFTDRNVSHRGAKARKSPLFEQAPIEEDEISSVGMPAHARLYDRSFPDCAIIVAAVSSQK